jgi:hypothetical protein
MPVSLALDSRGSGGQPGKGGWWRPGPGDGQWRHDLDSKM